MSEGEPDGNPFERRLARRGAVAPAGRRAEAKTARRLGATETLSSGAVPGLKGDMHTTTTLVENKATTAESLSLKRSWLEKITKEAAMEGKTPALAVQFVTPDGAPKLYGTWVLLPERDYKDYLDYKEWLHGRV